MKPALIIIALLCFSRYVSLTIAQPYKAVNLGGWLVAEAWILPSLFNGIANKDLLDGTQVQFRSTRLDKFLAAENGGGAPLVAKKQSASTWETFRLWRFGNSSFGFRVFNKQFVGINNPGRNVVATSNAANTRFRIVRKPDDPLRVRIQASNGQFLQARAESSVTANYDGSSDWGDQDPSVFQMTIVKTLQGEYQLTNGYGPDIAPHIMRDHWNSYIVEDDFRFMSQNGLNAVRIPVGWWIRFDQTPPQPFVGGSLQALDNAFNWAQKYNMKVIVDLHAVPGGQNEDEHSGSRDGYVEWGSSRIGDTVVVIEFLARRYANRPSLAAIELMNEPMAPLVSFDDLNNYYKQGYNAVRKYTSSAFVILSNRLGPASSTEFLDLGGSLPRSAIDVHYYHLNSYQFWNMNEQQHIDYVYNQRSSELQQLTQPNGPLIFIGEWTAEWGLRNAEKQDYQRFAKAQLDVYGRATFGWAYWSYKNVNLHWSLRRMINQNYVKL